MGSAATLLLRHREHVAWGSRLLVAKESVQGYSGSLAFRVECVDVEPHGQHGVAVPGAVCHGADVDTVGYQQAQVHVPGVVHPCPGDTGSVLAAMPARRQLATG